SCESVDRQRGPEVWGPRSGREAPHCGPSPRSAAGQAVAGGAAQIALAGGETGTLPARCKPPDFESGRVEGAQALLWHRPGKAEGHPRENHRSPPTAGTTGELGVWAAAVVLILQGGTGGYPGPAGGPRSHQPDLPGLRAYGTWKPKQPRRVLLSVVRARGARGPDRRAEYSRAGARRCAKRAWAQGRGSDASDKFACVK